MDGGSAPVTATATHRFDPAADPRAFRSALGAFATGVCVITTRSATGPVGITANSFASVSLDPPLVLWSPARASRRFPVFAEALHFAIHVLDRDQKWIGDAFIREGDIFDRLSWTEGPEGTPLIEGTLAHFTCRQEAVHDAGDHVLVLGRVTEAQSRPGEALIFQGGRYGGLTPQG